MEMMTLDPGVVHTCWNDSSEKMAAGTDDGIILVYEPDKGSRSFYSLTSKWKVSNWLSPDVPSDSGFLFMHSSSF